MKIIDFARKGNVVRFYLGENELQKWYGDDWDDAPYEHNTGNVYDEFIAEYKDKNFSFDSLVLEPSDNWSRNSVWSKDDMVKRLVPCIIVVPQELINECHDDFNYYVGMDGVLKYYFGDPII